MYTSFSVGLPCQNRVIFGVTVPLVGLPGLYSQLVLNRFIIDKGIAQRHREMEDEERKHKRGSMES